MIRKEFCLQHGINHLTTAPFHPASNGLAERFVQTFKTSVGKNLKDGYSVKTAVTKYLSSYCFTPHRYIRIYVALLENVNLFANPIGVHLIKLMK